MTTLSEYHMLHVRFDRSRFYIGRQRPIHNPLGALDTVTERLGLDSEGNYILGKNVECMYFESYLEALTVLNEYRSWLQLGAFDN